MGFWSGHDLNNDGSTDLFIHHKHNDPNGFLGVFLLCFIGLFVTSFFLFASFDDKDGSHLMGIGIFSIIGSAGIAALIGAKVCYGAQYSGVVPLGAILVFFIIGPIGTHWTKQSSERAMVAEEEATEARRKAELEREWAPMRAKRAAENLKVAAQTQRIEEFKSIAAKEGWTFSHAGASGGADGIIRYNTVAYLPAADGDAAVSIVYEPATGFGFAQLHFQEGEAESRYPFGGAVKVRSYTHKSGGTWEAYRWEMDSYFPIESVHRPDPAVADSRAYRLMYLLTEAVKSAPTRVDVEN